MNYRSDGRLSRELAGSTVLVHMACCLTEQVDMGIVVQVADQAALLRNACTVETSSVGSSPQRQLQVGSNGGRGVCDVATYGGTLHLWTHGMTTTCVHRQQA